MSGIDETAVDGILASRYLDPEWSEHQPKLLEEREITDAELITMVQRTAAAVADEPQLSDKLQELFADHFES